MEIANAPLVTVIMPSFNEAPDMVSGAIRSILQQTYKNIELLIFDDSTNDETRAAIDMFASDSRVTINRSAERVGFVPSLNLGLESARGEYIARMDGDDYSLPERIEKEVLYLETHQEIMVVGGNMNIMDENNQITSLRTYPNGGVKLYLFSCVRSPLAHPTIMMRRKVVDLGYRYDEELKMSEDLDLWLRLMNDGYKLANIPEVLINYRVMDNFLEKRSSDTQREVMARVRRKNFDNRHLLHSVLSIFSGWLFVHVPRGTIDKIYSKENKTSK